MGISFDTPADNKAFAEAQGFPYRLLSDPDHQVGAAYQALRPADDKLAAYPLRLTYLINPAGVIEKAYEVSDAATHADQVLADILSASAH